MLPQGKINYQNYQYYQPSQNYTTYQPSQNYTAYQPSQNYQVYQSSQNYQVYQPSQNYQAFQPTQNYQPTQNNQLSQNYKPYPTYKIINYRQLQVDNIPGPNFENPDPYLLDVAKSVCKIKIDTNHASFGGSGFFLKFLIWKINLLVNHK